MTASCCEGERPFGRLVASTVPNSTECPLRVREIAEKSRLIFLIHESEKADQTIRSSQTLQRLGLDERDVVFMDLPPNWLQDHSSPVVKDYHESRLFEFSNLPTFAEWDERGFMEQKNSLLLENVRTARHLILFCKKYRTDQENYPFLQNYQPFSVFDITKDEFFDPQPKTSPRDTAELI